jgi:hypothetical protein
MNDDEDDDEYSCDSTKSSTGEHSDEDSEYDYVTILSDDECYELESIGDDEEYQR